MGSPPNGESSNVVELTNDIPGLVLESIISTGGSTAEEFFTPNHVYTIDEIELADGGTFNVDTDETDTAGVTVENLTSAGEIMLINGRANIATATRITTTENGRALNPITDEYIISSGSSAQGQVNASGFTLSEAQSITIENGGQLTICGTEGTATFENDITLGGGAGADPSITINSCKGGGSPEAIIATPTYANIIFAGKIILQSDATINSQNSQAQVNGVLEANGNTLTLNAGNARIKGFGNVGTVILGDNSIISPGSSPGCISSTGLTFEEGSTYEFEIAGNVVCTEYDQIDVTGVVTITGGVLDTSLLSGFVPALNDEFIIVNNDEADAVTGEFDGLTNGATFEVDGVTFRINYDGGDGNDVVLTVTQVVVAPDTGIEQMLLNNPALTGLAAVASLVALSAVRFTSKR